MILDRSFVSVGVYTRDESLGQNLMLTPLLRGLVRTRVISSVICPREAIGIWKNPALTFSAVETLDALPRGTHVLATTKPSVALVLTKPRFIQLVDEIQDVESWEAIPGVTIKASRPKAQLATDYLAYIYATQAGYSRISKYPALWYPIDKATVLRAKQVLAQINIVPHSYVYLNISGGSNPTWRSLEPYIALSKYLLKRQLPIIVNNGPCEEHFISEYTKALKGYSKCVAVMPADLPVWVVGAIMRYARLVITKDSGIMHLSDAVHARTLAFTVRQPSRKYWLAPRTHITLLETDHEPTANTIAQLAEHLVNEIPSDCDGA